MEKKVLNKIELKTNEVLLGLHVRRGDSCNDPTAKHRQCLPLTFYFEKVLLLRKTYKYKKIVIYLSTDDPSTIKEAILLEGFDEENIRWVWQDISRERYVNGKVVDNNNDLFNKDAMDELYFDLWGISYCDGGFIGR